MFLGSGVILIIAVIGLLVVGGLMLSGWGGLSRFGRLPGDIRYERKGVRVFAPLMSMLLLSLVLTLVLALLNWLL